MKRMVVLTLLITALVTLNGPTYAEEKHWNIQLEPMYMDVKGNDVHVGDVLRKQRTLGPTSTKFKLTQKTDPIKLNMSEEVSFRGEIAYMKNQWGLGLSGWWLDGDDSTDGALTSPPDSVAPDGTVTSFSSSALLFGEEEFFTPGQTMTYFAEADLECWTTDLFVIRTLAEKKDSYVNLNFGLKLGNLNINREEGRILSFEDSNAKWDDLARSKSEADYDVLFGPVLGFQGKAKWRKLTLEGFVNQSLLIGEVDQKGTYTFAYIRDTTYSDTGESTFSKEETDAIPVTELRVKVFYDIFEHDAIRAAIGIGGFVSVWWDAPVAPEFKKEHLNWNFQESTLTFYGGILAFNVAF